MQSACGASFNRYIAIVGSFRRCYVQCPQRKCIKRPGLAGRRPARDAGTPRAAAFAGNVQPVPLLWKYVT